MIKEAIKYVVGLAEPHTQEIDGKIYSDKELERVVKTPYASAIKLTTLSSLVEYIKSGVDTMKGKMIVHIVNPKEVRVFSQLDDDRSRETVVTVSAKTPEIYFNNFSNRESFNIALQSKFVDNTDKTMLLSFIGTVEDGTVQEYGDDGVTQKATVRQGIASKADVIVPSPVTLKPYRTFTEVEQPESAFVFRMQQDQRSNGIACALFEADGGAWELEAMERIKKYLKVELADVDGFTIIS